MKNKSGRLTDEDKAFIELNAEKMPAEDIARHLLRNPNTIKRYLRDKLGLKTQLTESFKEDTVEQAIKKSIVWKELQGQFTKKELEKFLFHWRRIISQFGGDTLATEEMQAVDYIKMDLLMDRILTEQQRNLVDIAELERLITKERKSSTPNLDKVENYTSQIAFRRSAQEDIVKEYKDLLKEKQNLLKGMKATREARIKHLENSKQNIPDWIKILMMDENKRKEVGLYMEKMRLAMKKEEARLSQYHKYGDGIVQPPILTTETIKNKEDGK